MIYDIKRVWDNSHTLFADYHNLYPYISIIIAKAYIDAI